MSDLLDCAMLPNITQLTLTSYVLASCSCISEKGDHFTEQLYTLLITFSPPSVPHLPQKIEFKVLSA